MGSSNADKPTINFHNTDMGTFLRCRQLWDFTSNLRGNLEPIPTGVNALWFGTGIHLALYYFNRSAQGMGTRLPSRAYDAWNAFCDASADLVDQETYELGLSMLVYHCETWAPKNDNNKWVEGEIERHIPLFRLNRTIEKWQKGTIVNFSYRLDGLEQDENGLYWIKEYKTAGKWASSYDYLLNDDQSGRYIAAEDRLKPYRIAGVHYIILRKASPKPLHVNANGKFSVDKRQDTTHSIAESNMQDAWNGRPDFDKDVSFYQWLVREGYKEFLDYLAEKPDNFVQHHRVMRNDREIEGQWWSGGEIMREMIDRPAIYRTPSAWNCNGCSFFAPCVAKWEGMDYKTMLRVGYRQRQSYEAPKMEGDN